LVAPQCHSRAGGNPAPLRERYISTYKMGRSIVDGYYVYIMASKRNGTLYIGVTNNLARRVDEHRLGMVSGFTKRYGVHRLVYYEQHRDVKEAIAREKQMKKWRRAWKMNLIEDVNPDWRDLCDDLPL